LKSQLETALASYIGQVKLDIKEQLLIVRQSQPHFSFYTSFATNDHKTLAEWKELANILARLDTNGWSKYSPFQIYGYIILEEMEKFQRVKIFTIPSMRKPSLWNRMLGR